VRVSGVSHQSDQLSLFEVGVVDDPKSNAEVNGLKSLALDHLGTIATKLRGSPANNTDRKDVSSYSNWDEVSISSTSLNVCLFFTESGQGADLG
jgi:hypothetical protein